MYAVKEKCKKDVAERLWRSIIELYRKEEHPDLAGGFLSAGSKKRLVTDKPEKKNILMYF